MAKYVFLSTWTPQGIGSVTDTTKRAEQARALADRMGVRFESLLWTQGRYDLVSVVEAPDDETIAAFVLRVTSLGALRGETLRAFEADEMDRIIGRLG